MKGTEKQIEYAKDLREKYIDQIDGMVNGTEEEKFFKQYKNIINNIENAKTVIEITAPANHVTLSGISKRNISMCLKNCFRRNGESEKNIIDANNLREI